MVHAHLGSTWIRRSRSRRRSFDSGTRPAWSGRSSRCFRITSARNEQKTWPRIAAPEEWKVSRVWHDRLGPAEGVLDLEKIAVAQLRLKRGRLGVGAQLEDPVEARILGQLALQSHVEWDQEAAGFQFASDPFQKFQFLRMAASKSFHCFPKVAKNFRESGLIKGLRAIEAEKISGPADRGSSAEACVTHRLR